jgi:hypothetical protein
VKKQFISCAQQLLKYCDKTQIQQIFVTVFMFTVSVKCGHYDFRPGRQKHQLLHWSQTARMYSSLSVSNQISKSPAGIFIGGHNILNPVIGSTFQTSSNASPRV